MGSGVERWEVMQTPDNLGGGQDCSLSNGAMARAEGRAGANLEGPSQ